jgi:putative protease
VCRARRWQVGRDDQRLHAGLNMDDKTVDGAAALIRQHQRKLHGGQHLPATARSGHAGNAAVDRAAATGVDALIAADPGALDYAARQHPQMALHLSVQGSATTRRR